MVPVPLIFFILSAQLPSKKDALTKIESYIIEKVKEKRLAAELSQIALSQLLEMSDSFVGHVETPNRRAKYNVNHINALAKIFKCSPREFWPDKAL